VPPPGPGQENAHLTRAEAEQKLKDLQDLVRKGLITREDFERKKKEILDRL
jgi:predicted Zn-dependent peptidase